MSAESHHIVKCIAQHAEPKGRAAAPVLLHTLQGFSRLLIADS